MRHLIQHLPKQQAMFLLTLLTLEGEKDLPLLGYLPREEAQQLEHVARQLSETPRKQLLPQLVQEIKRLIADNHRSKLEQHDPAWLADLLQHESPQIIAVILQGLPRGSVQRIYQALPRQLAQRIPQQIGQVSPEIAKQIRQRIEERFPEPPDTDPPTFNLDSLSYLSSEELMLLIRELGFRELATAFSNVGHRPLMELCRRLRNEDAEHLLKVVQGLPPLESKHIKSAQRTIRAISNEHQSQSDMIEGAGMHKFSNALCASHRELLHNLAYRLPYNLGIRFHRHNPPKLTDNDILRLHHEVLGTLQSLAQEQRISRQWALQVIDLPPVPVEVAPEEGAGQVAHDEYDDSTGQIES
ncbi:MAG: hypothetical protein H6727_07845 [Myxococcales bacterium]|nr:hypothetical protein [Myxococcales bacterium]